MGNWFSKNDDTKLEQKVGTINNGNIVIHESLPVHNDEAIILIYIILTLIVAKIALKLYKMHTRRLQKQFYRKSTVNLALPAASNTTSL